MSWLPLLLAAFIVSVNCHGQLTIPSSNRVAGANPSSAGDCVPADGGRCLWFTSPILIPGPPTLPDYARSFNVEVKSGPLDWSRRYPWRAPGTAQVSGSGCGIAGGNKVTLFNGGVSPPTIPQGFDGADLPARRPVTWKKGDEVEVAFALTANHGGGYSYRLCSTDGDINEECFQRNQLDFAGDVSWIRWSPERRPGGPNMAIPRVTVSEGTFPKGSQWARNPVPACDFCQQAMCGNPTEKPCYTCETGTLKWGDKTIPYYGGKHWIANVRCGVICAGEDSDETWANNTRGPPSGQFCEGSTQFPEPLPGVSGFVTNTTFPSKGIDAFNVVDLVKIPKDIPSGSYLLSWRWDCEQSPQIWQNCADITITD